MVKEKQSLTCLNPKCNRTFNNPIFVENLSSEETISYSGCPYCLTRITETRTSCMHHFGYLSKSSRGKDIPEECITCEKVVECMLFKPKKSDKALKEIKKWYD